MRLVEKYIDHVLDAYATTVLGINELKGLPGHTAELENIMLKKAFSRFLTRTSEFISRENAMLIAKNERINTRLLVFISQFEDGSNTGTQKTTEPKLTDGSDDTAAHQLPERRERGSPDSFDTEEK